jgi:hypothetical protein
MNVSFVKKSSLDSKFKKKLNPNQKDKLSTLLWGLLRVIQEHGVNLSEDEGHFHISDKETEMKINVKKLESLVRNNYSK